jgi:hypothetical protein
VYSSGMAAKNSWFRWVLFGWVGLVGLGGFGWVGWVGWVWLGWVGLFGWARSGDWSYGCFVRKSWQGDFLYTSFGFKNLF